MCVCLIMYVYIYALNLMNVFSFRLLMHATSSYETCRMMIDLSNVFKKLFFLESFLSLFLCLLVCRSVSLTLSLSDCIYLLTYLHVPARIMVIFKTEFNWF